MLKYIKGWNFSKEKNSVLNDFFCHIIFPLYACCGLTQQVAKHHASCSCTPPHFLLGWERELGKKN